MPQYPPPRWLEYEPTGTPLKDTGILPIKLPIPKEMSGNIPRRLWFTDNDLLNYCAYIGRPLAGIIDLTFTRYYDPRLYTDRNAKYIKVYVEGHVIPSADCVKNFLHAVNDLKHNSPDGIIAVHCTHGINRTGYLVCRYLIDALDWSAEDAIREFALARGYPIERENYLNDLRHRPTLP